MFNYGASCSTTVRSSLCPLSPTQCTASTIHFGKFPSAISLEPFQLSSCTKQIADLNWHGSEKIVTAQEKALKIQIISKGGQDFP